MPVGAGPSRSAAALASWWSGEGLPEIERIEALAGAAPELVRLERLGAVRDGSREFPLLAVHVGIADRERPVFGLFGGVHGLERIGSHVVITFLESLVERLRWDKEARRMLRKCRLVAMPVVNPGGMWLRTRANPRGVDLMRNAPVDAEVHTPFLVGGHRLSPRLPWYRGRPGEWEAESRAVVDFVEREIFPARAALALDVHSGFGATDRLWFPYAKTTAPFPSMAQVMALVNLLDRAYPHHVYRIEQQSDAYTTHGDLWDYLYDRHRAAHPERLFVPWTLEIGSWAWVRKDPRSSSRVAARECSTRSVRIATIAPCAATWCCSISSCAAFATTGAGRGWRPMSRSSLALAHRRRPSRRRIRRPPRYRPPHGGGRRCPEVEETAYFEAKPQIFEGYLSQILRAECLKI